MNQHTLKRLVAGSALAATLLVASPPVFAQVSDRTDTSQTITRGVDGGKSGYWVNITERTFHWNSVLGRVQALAANSGLSQADINAIISGFQGANPTDAQIRAQINAVKDQNAINNWNATTASQRITIYAQAGIEAMDLAKSLSNYGTGSGLGSWNAGSVRGWPLQAAMIHNPEMNNINQDVLLKAWDIVWANVQARGWSLGDPLVLDLNSNKKIDVTGKSAAKYRAKENEAFVEGGSVNFDILGAGKEIRTEWITSGDGFLVDNRKNAARDLLAAGKNLTVRNLFGDTEGYAGGFARLASKFNSHARIASAAGGVPKDVGVIKGKDLDSLLVWVDDGDGIAKPDELRTLQSLGVSEIRLPAAYKRERGEFLEQASFIRNGKLRLLQEVWFAHE